MNGAPVRHMQRYGVFVIVCPRVRRPPNMKAYVLGVCI